MSFDIQNLSNNGIKSSEQRLLDTELPKHGTNQKEKYQSNKYSKIQIAQAKINDSEAEEKSHAAREKALAENVVSKIKIERDPMKLLKIVGLFASLFIFPTISGAETIIMTGDKWCPFNCDPQSNKLGYMVEVAKIIFERKGHNIDYQVNSWVKSIENVRNSKATALVATTKHDAPDFIYPTKAMGSNKDCFYVRTKDNWEFNEIDDLKVRKLGVVTGYAYSEKITNFINQNPKLTVNSVGKNPLSSNLNKLDAGVVDTIVENPFVFNYLVNDGKTSDKYEEAGCTEDNDLYIAFSPKNPRSKEFAKILTEGIEELRKDGTLDKIVAKYSLKDWR